MTTRAGVATIAPLVGVAVALLFALHDRLELVENRMLVVIGLAVSMMGIWLRVRDARTGEAQAEEARALRRRTWIAIALLGAASIALAVARALATPKVGLPGDLVAALVPPLLIGLARFNFGRFPGSVVVARDLGPENAQLACRLPGYRVLLAETDSAARDAHLRRMTDTTLATPHCDRSTLVPLTRPHA